MGERDFPSGETAEQMALFDCAKADRFRAMADEWVRANHGTWLWMVSQASSYAASKRRFSIARLVEEARYTKPVKGVDEYKINHDIRPELARRLIKAVPACKPYNSTRASVVDL